MGNTGGAHSAKPDAGSGSVEGGSLEPEAMETFLRSELPDGHGLTDELAGPEAWASVAYLELMNADMAASQWEVRDGEDGIRRC